MFILILAYGTEKLHKNGKDDGRNETVKVFVA